MATPHPPNAGVLLAPQVLEQPVTDALLAQAEARLVEGATAIVVDGSMIERVDEAAIAGLVQLAERVQERGATAHLYDLTPAIAIVLGGSVNAFSSVTVQ